MLEVNVSKAENFQNAIFLYATKPHIVNRQLAGAEQVSIYKYPMALKAEISKIDGYIRTHPNASIDRNYIPTLFDALDLKEHLVEIDKSQLTSEVCANESVIILNKLFAKNLKCHENCAELVYIGARGASFLPLDRTSILSKSFSLEMFVENGNGGSGELTARISSDDNRSTDSETKLINWIERTFLPKIQKWIESAAGGQNDQTMQSLALVNLQEYNELYNRLKMKYGMDMVKVSECTLG